MHRIWHPFPNVVENRTGYTRYVVDKIAELRGLTSERLLRATYDNAMRIFGLMNKIKIQEVIVVEGKDDTANLRRFYEVDTYETRGRYQ